MRGMMMDYPLTLRHFLDRNRRLYRDKTVSSRTPAGMERYTYADYQERVARLANALAGLDVGEGVRVGTLAWNTFRHLEFYYAVPCMGAVLHTINIRLPLQQIAFIINDAGDTVLAVDRELLPLAEAVRPQLTTVRHIIVMGDRAAPPDGYLDYETLLADASPDYEWPDLDENTAAGICYSSGTTGNPKGVVYSHRAIFLHSISVTTMNNIGLGEIDSVMPVVPMFHVNAWGLPHAAVAAGADLVLPGPAPTPADLLRLIQDERVTVAAGVPTIWIACLAELRKSGPYDLSSLRTVPCGGAAPPLSLIEAWERETGTPMLHAWGMTETSPVATASHLRSDKLNASKEEQNVQRAKQGPPLLGVDLTIMDDEGNELPWDGTTFGELVVRGPWVTAGYLHADTPDRFTNGWFRTGDVATIDPDGYVQIVDRTKDVIKSGGEWISSVELENLIMGHSAVLEAAVVARPDTRWGERPIAYAVLRPDAVASPEDILDSVRPHVAKYMVPDEVIFVDEIPKTSVGKFDKKVLRQRMAAESGVVGSR